MKILIVGLGSIALKHIEVLKQIFAGKILEIDALRSNFTENKIDGINNIYEIPASGRSDDSGRGLYDFAIISNPTSSHLQTIRQLLPYKIPLFIEKPAFHSLENIDELLAEINENNIFTYIACNLRFSPVIQFLKKYLQENPLERINEVNVYCGSYLPNWRPNRDFREIYSAIPELGGGVHLDLIHELDYTYWLFGKPLLHTKILRNNSTLAIKSIDYAQYNYIYADFVANITLNYFRPSTKRSIEIVFENKILTADLVKNEVLMNNEVIFEKNVDKLYSYHEQMKYFLENLSQNTKPMNAISEAVEVLKICLKDDVER